MSGDRLTLDDIRGKATITADELSQLLGCSRGLAFEALRRNEIPSLRVGRRVFVPVPRLLALLGDELDD